MTDTDRIQALKQGLDQLSERDQEFAQSLIDQEARRGLSDKQWYWVEKLADRAHAVSAPEPDPQVGDFTGVYAIFTRAREHLKFPKIRLQTADGEPVALGVAGPRSKRPGVINVTDGGRFGENRWYGRIETDGSWDQPRDGVPANVVAVIQRLADEPATVASEYGRLTGNCCFCRRERSDERSTEVGYGATCADHFGLPWGSKHQGQDEVDEGLRHVEVTA